MNEIYVNKKKKRENELILMHIIVSFILYTMYHKRKYHFEEIVDSYKVIKGHIILITLYDQ